MLFYNIVGLCKLEVDPYFFTRNPFNNNILNRNQMKQELRVGSYRVAIRLIFDIVVVMKKFNVSYLFVISSSIVNLNQFN